MRVAVTGGSGFIGSHVVDQLLAAGHETRSIDLVESPYSDVETFVGDILDVDFLRRALSGCDVLIHLAAVADVNDVVREPERAERINVSGTHALLRAARAEGTPHFVYGSTIWVYGDATSPEPLDEDAALPLPVHLYTATKLAGEMLCRSYGSLFGQRHTILRFGIPYGPRARPTTVLAAFVARALAGEPITIAGDGTQSRRFVYVEDLAAGVVASLGATEEHRIYNLVGSESVSVRAIAQTVRELIGGVAIVHEEARPGDLHGAHISGERAAAELDWRPATSFADGAARYVEWVADQSSASTIDAAEGRAANERS